MVLGSVATVVVLALGVIEGPKFFGAKASGDTQNVTPPPQFDQPPVPSRRPEPQPSIPVFEQGATPIPQGVIPSSPTPANPNVERQRTPPPEKPRAQATPPPTPAPAPAPQAQPAPAAPPPPAQPPAADRAQLNELRERYNDLSIRASSTRDGLRSIEQQMARQGLGLRGDIKEAATRSDYQLHEAMDSIRAGDIDNAKQHLDMAERAIDAIYKFLGR
jgi:hypothetical protein